MRWSGQQADHGGFPVSRLEHSLQTATLAEQGGESDEYVLCALLHDVGDPLSPGQFHPDVAAAIVAPVMSETHAWMVAEHGVFQGLGRDDLRHSPALPLGAGAHGRHAVSRRVRAVRSGTYGRTTG